MKKIAVLRGISTILLAALWIGSSFGVSFSIPIRDGVYVSIDVRPCNGSDQAQANTVWIRKGAQSWSYAHMGCDVVSAEKIGKSTYEVAKQCSYMSAPDSETEKMVSKITVNALNEFTERN